MLKGRGGLLVDWVVGKGVDRGLNIHIMVRSYFKTQFPLRTAAIFSRGVVGTKIVLDVAPFRVISFACNIINTIVKVLTHVKT